MDSAQQICIDAAAIAKARGMSTFAGRFLQSTLNDLCLHRNLKINLTSVAVNFAANSNGPYNLPQAYLRPYDLTYTVQGYPYEMDQITLAQYDQLFQSSSIANYPTMYATDLRGLSAIPPTPPLLYVYPQSNSALNATLRYFIKQPEMAAPLDANANVPWFEDQDYLRADVARQLMMITDDERLGEFTGAEGICERMLRKHLIMEGDEVRLPKTIVLDPLRFRFGQNVKPTKISPF